MLFYRQKIDCQEYFGIRTKLWVGEVIFFNESLPESWLEKFFSEFFLL